MRREFAGDHQRFFAIDCMPHSQRERRVDAREALGVLA